MSSVKALVESGCLPVVPPNYVALPSEHEIVVFHSEERSIPVVDFSLLTSGNPDERSKAIQDIGDACREWGFFMVINHGMRKKLMQEMVTESMDFFNLGEEEKEEYKGKKLFDPIRSGTSFNVSVDESLFWRDYLKVHVHPRFNAPTKPTAFREISEEYCREVRAIASELLKGISLSLGLEESYINKAMEVEKGSQLLVVNLYSPCPQPELAIGMPPHSDHGLLTLLIQNEPDGLQILHKNKWVPISPLPNSIIVNVGDHMQILTNGQYKSVVHRAVVNKYVSRISVATAHGPPLDKAVCPAGELVDQLFRPPTYRGISYRDYMQLQQNNPLNGKSCLDRVQI